MSVPFLVELRLVQPRLAQLRRLGLAEQYSLGNGFMITVTNIETLSDH